MHCLDSQCWLHMSTRRKKTKAKEYSDTVIATACSAYAFGGSDGVPHSK